MASADFKSVRVAAQPGLVGSIPMRFRQISLHCVALALRASPLRSDKSGRIDLGKGISPSPFLELFRPASHLPWDFVGNERVQLPPRSREKQNERVTLVRFGQDAGMRAGAGDLARFGIRNAHGHLELVRTSPPVDLRQKGVETLSRQGRNGKRAVPVESQIGLRVDRHDARRIHGKIGECLFGNLLLLVGGSGGAVDGMNHEVGIANLGKRRTKRRDDPGRKLSDQADRVDDERVAPAELADSRIEGREQAIRGDLRSFREAVEERRLARVGVPGDRDLERMAPSAFLDAAGSLDLGEVFLQQRDSMADFAPIELELLLARAAAPDSASEPRQTAVFSGEPGQQVLVTRELDLRARFAAPGVQGEDFQDEARAVCHPGKRLLEISHLPGRKIVVEHDEVRRKRFGGGRDRVHRAGTDERRRVEGGSLPQVAGDDFAAGRVDEPLELVEMFFHLVSRETFCDDPDDADFFYDQRLSWEGRAGIETRVGYRRDGVNRVGPGGALEMSRGGALEMSPRDSALRDTLETLSRTYGATSIDSDPIRLVHRYSDPRDVEVAGWVTSAFAYGRVDIILANVSRLLAFLGPRPARRLVSQPPSAADLSFFRHRFHGPEDAAQLLALIGGILRDDGSVRSFFETRYRGEENTGPLLDRVSGELLCRTPRARAPMRFLFPSPSDGSACKRWNLYLRWMVRSDEIDFGVWGGIPARALVIPTDTHIHRISRRLGLTRRKTADWKTALEITKRLSRLDSNDPVKYDFALCRLGILEICRAKPRLSECPTCVARPVCPVGRRRTAAVRAA